MPSNTSSGHAPEKGDVHTKLLFWMAATVTTAWIGSIAWGVNQVTGQINRLTAQQEKFSTQFTDYITKTESRLTALEVQARTDRENK